MENKMGHNVFSASTTVSKVTFSHLRRDVKKSASYIENVILFVHKRQFAVTIDGPLQGKISHTIYCIHLVLYSSVRDYS
jgi:hypothetical protein